MLSSHSVLIIGGGNMGTAMAARWRTRVSALQIVEPDAGRRSALAAKGFACHADLMSAARPTVAILAIKPQQFAAHASAIKSALSGATVPLVISIMAGVPLGNLAMFGSRVVRVMPNLPSTIGEGMSVLCTTPVLDAASRTLAEQLFRAIGKTAWVENEAEFHAVTAVSGSGPAYVFALMEAMEEAAVAQGLAPTLARQLVRQTARGAALLADQSAEEVTALREQVTSKGGTTEAALAQLVRHGFGDAVGKAVAAAAERSHELAK